MGRFQDKVAVVTGAGSGIGRALALQLADAGARVAISDVATDALDAVAADIAARHGDDAVLAEVVDVADRKAMHAHADHVVAHFGGVHIVVNNAGVAVSQTVAKLSYDDLEWIMGINFWGVVHGTKAFLPHLQEQAQAGAIASLVNVASVFALIATPTQGAYNTSKFAVRGLTEALWHESRGTGLHVMGVYPCGVRTDIARSSRFYVDPFGHTDSDGGARQLDAVSRTSPEQMAKLIIEGIAKRKRRVLNGPDAHIVDFAQRLLPERYWSVIQRITPKAG